MKLEKGVGAQKGVRLPHMVGVSVENTSILYTCVSVLSILLMSLRSNKALGKTSALDTGKNDNAFVDKNHVRIFILKSS